MITVSQFAKRIRRSRQRVHQLIAAQRIKPAPKLVGSQYVLDPKAAILPPQK